MKPIPYGRQDIIKDDIEAVIKVLKSDYLTQGPEIERFEHSFADYIGAEFAIAVSNGTAALHLSALALNIQPGDKVITSPITFAASANCVRYCGGEIVFADIDAKNYCIDINKVEELLKNEPKGNFKGIILVDFAGFAVDLESFRKLADDYDLWIIEDACHAPGGFFIDSLGTKILCGSGNFADLTVFSFHPVKHIACGEGGMITTNNKFLYDRLNRLRTHGITKEPQLLKENHGGWYYEMQELGFNYRLTDIQAALGESQLKKAEKGLKRRKQIALRYERAFEEKNFIKGQSGMVDGHAYHLYIIEVEDRKGLYDYLRQHKIFAQVHYIPIHLMPYYKQFGWKEGDFPIAETFYQRCISLPMFPALTDEEQKYVIEHVIKYYDE